MNIDIITMPYILELGEKMGRVRVVVVGSSGQLGSHLVPAFDAAKYDVTALQHHDIECRDRESVRTVLEPLNPNVVINCGALTDVDKCQDYPSEAFQVNALGALYVAEVCARVGSLCVYTSTDFVFDGEKGEPYLETDSPNPINVYGASKYAGEILLRQACPQWLIVRISSLFGPVQEGVGKGSFIDTVVKKAKAGMPLQIVDDVYMCPTYVCDIAQALELLVRQRAMGVLHLSNAGCTSWYRLAKKTFDIMGLSPALKSIKAADYPYKAKPPKNSSLNRNIKNNELDEILRPWHEALEVCLQDGGC